MAQRKSFSREFKVEAVQLASQRGQKLGVVARELGLRTDMLERWQRQLQGTAPGTEPIREAEQELRRVKRELDRVRLEL